MNEPMRAFDRRKISVVIRVIGIPSVMVQEALTEEVEGCSRPFTEDGLRRKEIPNFCMGVIAGVRYCESAESGRTDKGRELHYATAISHANTVSSTWADQGIRCGLNMGNIIDRWVFPSQPRLKRCPAATTGHDVHTS